MKKLLQAVALLTVLFLTDGTKAQAGEPRLLSTHSDWAAYMFIEDGNKVCYIASQPVKAEGDYQSRGEIFALVTHRPVEGSKNVFSYIAGYTYKPGSDATLTIDGDKLVLFTQDDTAWAPDAETDTKIAGLIRSGSKMTVKGTSSRGTATTDNFSLKGSGAAYDAASKECGVK